MQTPRRTVLVVLTIRTPILFAIVVCATAIVLAETPENNEAAWNQAQLAGFEKVSQGHFDEAMVWFRQSWELAASDTERAAAAGNIGIVLHANGGSDTEALEWLERAYTLVQGAEPTAVLAGRIDIAIGEIKRNAGDYKAAEAFLDKALTASVKEPMELAVARNALADLLREQGRTDEAKSLFHTTLALPQVTPQLRQEAMIGLADIDRSEGKPEASAQEWNSAIELARSSHDQVSEAIALRGLGEMWFDAGAAARAEPLFRQSLGLLEANPSAPEQKAMALIGLGRIYHLRNKLAMAEEFLLKALAIERKVLGDHHPRVAQLMEEIAAVYADRGSIGTARDWAGQAFEMMRGAFGMDSMAAASALTTKAYVDTRDKHMNAAAEEYAQALDIARCHPEHWSFRLGLIRRYQDVLKELHRNREVAALDVEAQSAGRVKKD